jgi:hypothetical protein
LGSNLLCLFFCSIIGVAEERAWPALFPEMEQWHMKGNLELFTAENLFKYIDGAAENFLSFDFCTLAVRTYENAAGATVTVEIYRQGTPLDTFGIYASESPLPGNYLVVGTEGYGEGDILNFFVGEYYVKMAAFDLGERAQTVLGQFAQRLAAALPGRAEFPPLLRLFPEIGLVPHSIRYLRANFLGYAFLHTGYSADYERDGKRFQLFIIQADDAAEAQGMLQRLTQHDQNLSQALVGESIVLQSYAGRLHLFLLGRYIAGINGAANDDTFYLDLLKKALSPL